MELLSILCGCPHTLFLGTSVTTYTFVHIQKCENNRRLGKRAEMFIPIIVSAHSFNRAECHSSWTWCRCWSCWCQALAQKSTQLRAPQIWRACCFCLVVGKMIILMKNGDVFTLRHMIFAAFVLYCVSWVRCVSCIDDVGLFGNSSNGLSENHKSVMSGADIYTMELKRWQQSSWSLPPL